MEIARDRQNHTIKIDTQEQHIERMHKMFRMEDVKLITILLSLGFAFVGTNRIAKHN